MRRIGYLSVILLLLLACQKSFSVQSITNSQQKLTDEYTAIDSTIEQEISPYRTELSKSMGKVLVLAQQDLAKAKPSSPLGNLLADATKIMAAKYTGQSIDIGIMNYGGIRVPSVSKGPVTLGNAYELMPFDNYLVVLELNGTMLLEVFDKIAGGGGWPISGASFTIKEGKANSVMIGNEALNLDKVYTVAISDYLANGGDNLAMLKGIPQENTNILLRDAFIDYFEGIHAKGEMLDAKIENRIVYE